MEPDKKKQKTESSPSKAVPTSTEVSHITAAKKPRNEEHPNPSSNLKQKKQNVSS